MNKKMLAELLAQRTNISFREAGETIDHVVDIIQTSITNGVPVSLRGFGTFSMRQRAARMVSNKFSAGPRRIPGAMVPVFRPSRKMRRNVK